VSSSRTARAALAALAIALVPAGAARAAAPVVVIDAPATAQTGQPVAFDGDRTTDPDGQAMTYAWAIDGQLLDVENPWLSVSFAHPGMHVVTLTATDATGASASASHAIALTGIDRLPSSLKPFGPALAGAGSAAEVVVRAPRIRVAKRRLRLVVSCRRATRCHGTLRIVALKGRHRTPYLLAQRSMSVGSGRPRVVHVKLGPKGRRRLGRGASVRATIYRGGKVRTASIWGVTSYRVRVAR
jgi:hypothetical protein